MNSAMVKETADFLKRRGFQSAQIGIILGTGLGGLARKIKKKKSVAFEDCPYFPRATSVGHTGRLVWGTLHGRKVMAMEGRFHLFEGHDLKEVAYPVRVFKALGVKVLVLSNAAGGLNPEWSLGDIMLVSDHINLQWDSPLIGPNDESQGERFPDMSEPYDRLLRKLAQRVALQNRIRLQSGVYVGVKGPQLETKAEYRFLKQIGADTVGMSTIPEVIVARHAKMRVLAFSCITDMCLPDALKAVSIEKILQVAKKTEPVLTRLVIEVIRRI